MTKVVWLVSLYEESSDFKSYSVIPVKVFLTKEAANKYCLDINPKAFQGFEYIYPDDGHKCFRGYWVDPIVLEEE